MIVDVALLAAKCRPDAGSSVEREEEQTPALVLANVRVLVRAVTSEHVVVDPQDDVPERDRAEPAPCRQQVRCASKHAARDLEHALDTSRTRTGGKSHACETEPDQLPGRGPSVAPEARGRTKSAARAGRRGPR